MGHATYRVVWGLSACVYSSWGSPKMSVKLDLIGCCAVVPECQLWHTEASISDTLLN